MDAYGIVCLQLPYLPAFTGQSTKACCLIFWACRRPWRSFCKAMAVASKQTSTVLHSSPRT